MNPFTLPDDSNEEPAAGYRWLNLKWFYKLLRKKDPYQSSVEWHDSATLKGSSQERAGISADRVQDAFEEQNRELDRNPDPEWKNWPWLRRRIRRVYDQVTYRTRKIFYDGPK